MTYPTRKEFVQIQILYRKFVVENKGRTGVDALFLKNAPKRLHAAIKHLQGTGTYHRTLLQTADASRLHFKCAACKKSMFSPTEHYCSNKCVKRALNRFLSEDWTLVKVYSSGRGSVYNRAVVKCAHCSGSRDEYVRGFVKGYSCKCQRGRKIRDTRLSQRPSDYPQSAFDERGLNVKVLSEYINQLTKIKFKCLDCGTTSESLVPNILSGRGCRPCGAAKYKANCLTRTGHEWYSQTAETKANVRKAMLVKYGVEHGMQNREIFEKMQKSSARLREYKLGRRAIRVQGYEPQALDWLLANTSLKPKHLVCGVGSDVPSVKYKLGGMDRTYHPDIYVPHMNLIIEVKSVRTYKMSKARNKAKAAACRAAGFGFRFLVMNSDGTRCHDYKNH